MRKPIGFASEFEFTPDNRAVIISLIGKLTPEAVEDLHPQVQEVFRAGVRRFVFDLSGLEFAGSLGLRLLVGLHNQVKGHGRVAVCCPSAMIQAMLEMTKLTMVLKHCSSREEALAATLVE